MKGRLAVTERNEKPSVEDSFRASLEDVLVVAEKMAPVCQTVDDLAGMVKLALHNEGQFRLLMEIVTRKAKS